ncbi:MAG: hypothetical protein HY909_28295, partial [Deltaproteobacteria bacterium]|nr:hypothetical protein [Deltaproteobacteria bacterium]
MVSYPLTTTFVQPGETLGLVVRVLQRPDDQSVAHVAAANDCSPAHLYDIVARCREALQPHRPGPDPRAGKILRLEARVAELEADRARDRARIAELQGQLCGTVRLAPQARRRSTRPGSPARRADLLHRAREERPASQRAFARRQRVPRSTL